MKIDHFSASIILINKGKILMQLRDNKPDIAYPGYWSLPGGSVNPSEDIKEAAKRGSRVCIEKASISSLRNLSFGRKGN